MKLLVVCTIFALCVFMQVACAQEDDVEVKVAPAAAEAHKQDDEEASLEDRGGAYGLNNGGRYRSQRNRNLNGVWGGSNRGRGLRGGLRRERGRGSSRGAGRGIIQNIRVTNKVVPGYTEVWPTKETHSRERHDVRSESNSYYRQNSASTITQNNKRKQTFIHTHLNQVYYHPRHVNHIHKHHHTTFVKQLFPEVKKVYISQKQKIIEPEKLTIVKYTQDTSFANKVYPTKVQKYSRNQQLETIRKAPLNIGVRNIGSPLAITQSVRSFNGFESGNKGFANNRYEGGASRSRGVYGRAGEEVEAKVEEATAQVAVEAKKE